jgi:hypothetical protein
MDVAARQSKRLASFTASMQDTVHWDPANYSQSCSTPHIRGHPRKLAEASEASPPSLETLNRFAPLPIDDPPAPSSSRAVGSTDGDLSGLALHRSSADPRTSAPPLASTHHQADDASPPSTQPDKSRAVATMNAPPLPTLDRATSKSATQQVKPPSGFRPSLQLTAGQADT